jgi:hypothetical protein
MLHAHPNPKRVSATCKCGGVTLEGPKDVVRRIADRVDVRFRCHRCKARLVWHEGQAPSFAAESEVGP